MTWFVVCQSLCVTMLCGAIVAGFVVLWNNLVRRQWPEVIATTFACIVLLFFVLLVVAVKP